MNGYIVLSALLLLALSACVILFLRLKEAKKAAQEAKKAAQEAEKASQFCLSAFRRDHSFTLTATSMPTKIEAMITLPSGTPEKVVEEMLTHKLAACLPSFWSLEKRYDYDVEYRASVYVYKSEDAMP